MNAELCFGYTGVEILPDSRIADMCSMGCQFLTWTEIVFQDGTAKCSSEDWLRTQDYRSTYIALLTQG